MANKLWEGVKKNWFYILLGLVLAVALINYTTPGAYDFGCCTFNNNSVLMDVERSCDKAECDCGGTGWDGECTDEIEDECCEPVRLCSGQQTQNPMECYTYYCYGEDEMCYPVYNVVSSGYTCTCKDCNEYDNL